MKMRKSTADVCVIEVLRPKDYACFGDDGKGLVAHLQLLGYDAQYYRVYTFESFKDALRRFKQSGYRFLHISCHGSKSGLEFWTKDDVNSNTQKYDGEERSYDEVSQAFSGTLGDRRITFSTCELGNLDFD